jgi:hypothetical protein
METTREEQEILIAVKKETWPIGLGEYDRAVMYCKRKFKGDIPQIYKTVINKIQRR